MNDITGKHPCLSEEDLAELAFEPHRLTSGERAHIEECSVCSPHWNRYAHLQRSTIALPREAEMGRNVWPDIERGMAAPAAPRIETRRFNSLARMAIAAGIIGIAFALGRASVSPQSVGATPASTVEPVAMPTRDVLAAAVEVQEAGTAYLTALANLKSTGAEQSQAQGREAAVAVIQGATLELVSQGWQTDNMSRVAELLERQRVSAIPEKGL